MKITITTGSSAETEKFIHFLHDNCGLREDLRDLSLRSIKDSYKQTHKETERIMLHADAIPDVCYKLLDFYVSNEFPYKIEVERDGE